MPIELNLLIELALALIPILKKSELDRLTDAINKRQKEWEDYENKILEEIGGAGTIPELNTIIAKLLRRVQG